MVSPCDTRYKSYGCKEILSFGVVVVGQRRSPLKVVGQAGPPGRGGRDWPSVLSLLLNNSMCASYICTMYRVAQGRLPRNLVLSRLISF